MSEYRRTLFDKHGPGAIDRIRARVYGLMVFVITFGALALEMGLSRWTFLWSTVAGCGVTAAVMLLSKAAGDGWYAVAMSGASTPYEEQYSYEQSLVMQGKVHEAIASFEARISTTPLAIEPRIRAAELYVQLPDGARRAAELLREAQRVPSIAAGRDIYATNRLVDLLAGPLGDPGRAVVELRRLIERYPTSSAAKHASEAITSIKRSMAEDAARSPLSATDR